MTEQQPPEERLEKVLPIEWSYPPGLKSHFVTNIVVQHQEDHFVMAFFEVWSPPILGDSDEEKKRELAKLEKVDAVCVARVVVTPKKMREFVATLTKNLALYERTLRALEGGGE